MAFHFSRCVLFLIWYVLLYSRHACLHQLGCITRNDESTELDEFGILMRLSLYVSLDTSVGMILSVCHPVALVTSCQQGANHLADIQFIEIIDNYINRYI